MRVRGRPWTEAADKEAEIEVWQITVLRPVVLVALAGVLAYTLGRPALGEVESPRLSPGRQHAVALAGGGLIGLYDGFIGPGTGGFLVFLLVGAVGLSFLHASATAKAVNTMINLSALVTFALGGHVLWGLGAAMAAANLAGSQVRPAARGHQPGILPSPRGDVLTMAVTVVRDNGAATTPAALRRESPLMTTHSPLGIEATGLVKSFGATRAVDGVDLAVPAHSVYAVLGPNGAGKTTTIRMLATLLRPDGGSARVLGHDIVTEADAVRRVVSLTGQLASVDEDLTGRENLILLGRLLGLSRAAAKSRAGELLDAFGLSEAAGKLVKHYSGGMRRRLDIAASIVVTPQLMFLDEPTTGLDPRSRNQVWSIVRALVAEGTTILLCTQYLEEADQLADGIAVIDRGKVIAEGTPAQLKASVGSGALHVRLLDPQQRTQAAELLDRALGAVSLEADPAALTATCSEPERAADAIAALTRSGVGVASFTLGQPSLDEVFLALTGHTAEDVATDAQIEETEAV